LRIISGKYKGRSIRPPRGLPVRPTTDLAKTALFNILESRYDLSTFRCLDLFCGTGNISFELVSRDCIDVTAVDKEPSCVAFIRKTSTELSMSNLYTVKSEAMRYLRQCVSRFDLIFADPPFDSEMEELLVAEVFSRSLLSPGGIFILEHFSKKSFAHLKGFTFERKYGSVAFSFFNNLDTD
jgi:16S rRNA (guanine(966)-N(2))-methyltransferase RsmD